jgi:hypothetical protein
MAGAHGLTFWVCMQVAWLQLLAMAELQLIQWHSHCALKSTSRHTLPWPLCGGTRETFSFCPQEPLSAH